MRPVVTQAIHERSAALKALVCFMPLLIAGLWSLGRDAIVTIFNTDLGAGTSGIFYYHALRAGWYGLFIWIVMQCYKNTPDQELPRKSQTFQHNASSKDPLLGLRFFAFMMVFFGHWFLVVFPSRDIGAVLASSTPYWLLTASPWAGVWVFFTLSGYLMAKGFISGRYNLDWQGITLFYRKRALRIFPIYYSAIMLVGLLTAPGMFKLWDQATLAHLLDLIMLDSRGDAPPIGALWSISTEFQFYIMAPFLTCMMAPFFKSWRNIIVGFITISVIFLFYKCWVTGGFGLAHWHAYVYMPVVVNLDLFLFGIMSAYAVELGRKNNLEFKHGLNIGVALVVLMYLAISFASAKYMVIGAGDIQGYFTSIAPVVTGLMTALCIMMFELRSSHKDRRGPVSSSLWWLASQGGILTYVLYVWSEPVMLALRKIAPPFAELGKMDALVYLLFLGCPILLAVAAFFYYMVELPFDKKRSMLS